MAPERDWFRRLMGWLVPWFDPDRHDRQLATAERVMDQADRVIHATREHPAPSRYESVAQRYRRYDGVVRR